MQLPSVGYFSLKPSSLLLGIFAKRPCVMYVVPKTDCDMLCEYLCTFMQSVLVCGFETVEPEKHKGEQLGFSRLCVYVES